MWLLPSLILHVFPTLIFVVAARKNRVLMNFYLYFIKGESFDKKLRRYKSNWL